MNFVLKVRVSNWGSYFITYSVRVGHVLVGPAERNQTELIKKNSNFEICVR